MDALPVNAPTNVVDVTELNPASVVPVPPNAIFVKPIVIELFVNAPFGILVNPAPDPANCVAVKIPVLGLNDSFVLDTFAGLLPEDASTQVIYFVALVVVSFVIAILAAFVAFVADAAKATVPVTDIVTAPVADDTEIFVPATALVTPVLEITFAAMLIPEPFVYVPTPEN